jgi:hypothetical protein
MVTLRVGRLHTCAPFVDEYFTAEALVDLWL